MGTIVDRSCAVPQAHGYDIEEEEQYSQNWANQYIKRPMITSFELDKVFMNVAAKFLVILYFVYLL